MVPDIPDIKDILVTSERKALSLLESFKASWEFRNKRELYLSLKNKPIFATAN